MLTTLAEVAPQPMSIDHIEGLRMLSTFGPATTHLKTTTYLKNRRLWQMDEEAAAA